eukprot:760928-Hanusia_phi.AAC.1
MMVWMIAAAGLAGRGRSDKGRSVRSDSSVTATGCTALVRSRYYELPAPDLLIKYYGTATRRVTDRVRSDSDQPGRLYRTAPGRPATGGGGARWQGLRLEADESSRTFSEQARVKSQRTASTARPGPGTGSDTPEA